MVYVCLMFVACLTSKNYASVSRGRICSDKVTCCGTEIEVPDQMFYLTQSHMLTPDQPVPALTHAPGRVASGVAIVKSLV